MFVVAIHRHDFGKFFQKRIARPRAGIACFLLVVRNEFGEDDFLAHAFGPADEPALLAFAVYAAVRGFFKACSGFSVYGEFAGTMIVCGSMTISATGV